MSSTLEKIEAQRVINKAKGVPRHAIGPNELQYLYDIEQTAIRMKMIGDILASLMPTSEAAAEWGRITKDISVD